MFPPQIFCAMKTIPELWNWRSKGSHINSSYADGLSLGSWKLPVSWQMGMDPCLSFLSQSSPAWWQSSQRFFKSSARLKIPDFCPAGFSAYGPETSWGLENLDCPKSLPELIWKMLWNPQADVLFCSKNKKARERNGFKNSTQRVNVLVSDDCLCLTSPLCRKQTLIHIYFLI